MSNLIEFPPGRIQPKEEKAKGKLLMFPRSYHESKWKHKAFMVAIAILTSYGNNFTFGKSPLEETPQRHVLQAQVDLKFQEPVQPNLPSVYENPKTGPLPTPAERRIQQYEEWLRSIPHSHEVRKYICSPNPCQGRVNPDGVNVRALPDTGSSIVNVINGLEYVSWKTETRITITNPDGTIIVDIFSDNPTPSDGKNKQKSGYAAILHNFVNVIGRIYPPLPKNTLPLHISPQQEKTGVIT